MPELQLPLPEDESTDLTPLLSDVFISYSHVDEEFVNRLVEALKAANRIIWVDRRKIPPAADWQQKIYTGIETASSFVFVLSPDAIISEPCLKESKHASLNRKRIIPLVYRTVDYQNVPEELQIPQWILFTQGAFDPAFKKLLYALETDQAYWNEATRLLTYAKEWERQGKDQSSLLRGKRLKEVERWMQEGAAKIPRPAPIVMDFIQTSRKQRKRIRRRTLVVSLIGVTVLIALGVEIERPQQVIQQEIYPPQPLPYTYTGHTTAVTSVAWSPDGKRIASVGSNDGTVQVWNASSGMHLLTYTGYNLINYSSTTFAVHDAAWSPDGNRIVSTGEDGTVQVWDASRGTHLFTYTGHMMIQGHMIPSITVFTVAWSPDGYHIASASDQAVQVWFML